MPRRPVSPHLACENCAIKTCLRLWRTALLIILCHAVFRRLLYGKIPHTLGCLVTILLTMLMIAAIVAVRHPPRGSDRSNRCEQ